MVLAQDLTELQSKCLLGLQSSGGETGAVGFTSRLNHVVESMYEFHLNFNNFRWRWSQATKHKFCTKPAN